MHQLWCAAGKRPSRHPVGTHAHLPFFPHAPQNCGQCNAPFCDHHCLETHLEDAHGSKGCVSCGKASSDHCSGCEPAKARSYCSKACLVKDWKAGHKAECPRLDKKRAEDDVLAQIDRARAKAGLPSVAETGGVQMVSLNTQRDEVEKEEIPLKLDEEILAAFRGKPGHLVYEVKVPEEKLVQFTELVPKAVRAAEGVWRYVVSKEENAPVMNKLLDIGLIPVSARLYGKDEVKFFLGNTKTGETFPLPGAPTMDSAEQQFVKMYLGGMKNDPDVTTLRLTNVPKEMFLAVDMIIRRSGGFTKSGSQGTQEYFIPTNLKEKMLKTLAKMGIKGELV